MIIRYGPPSKMDHAPFGVLCKVKNSSDKVEIYKQISHDEENPNWILIDEYSGSSNDNIHASQKVTDASVNNL